MMEKPKRRSETPLPEPIIQHIQSFLSGKEAAQTTVLSKSWYGAWLTRPNIVFDQRDFKREFYYRGNASGFWEFTQKTVQRYEELNLKIDSFKLLLYGYSHANELIAKAIKMGATDLDFELSCRISDLILPPVVLGSENLARLSVKGCKIKLGADEKVKCSGLKFLKLGYVYIDGDIIWDIISKCPLIEKLTLSNCEFDSERRWYRLAADWKASHLELSPYIEFGKKNVKSVVDVPVYLHEFRKLKSLSLCRVNIHHLFFRDFWSKFPCLKNLSIDDCGGYNYNKIHIFSRSLECISFKQTRAMRVTFHVPNIRKFGFIGVSSLPTLTFQTASSQWESDVSVSCDNPSSSWFLKLKKMVARLSGSKISLSLKIGRIVEKSVDLQSSYLIAVENLTLRAPPSACNTLMRYIFWSYRPKFITQNWLPQSRTYINTSNKVITILCEEHLISTFGLHNLMEVNAELFEESLAQWRPVSVKTFSDSPKGPEKPQKVRFQLRWKS